ncbi:MAG: hypothetical protein FWD86_02225 [Firmicutes bacterium]|nr:hypothetical protein [Bacillota bacterium]
MSLKKLLIIIALSFLSFFMLSFFRYLAKSTLLQLVVLTINALVLLVAVASIIASFVFSGRAKKAVDGRVSGGNNNAEKTSDSDNVLGNDYNKQVFNGDYRKQVENEQVKSTDDCAAEAKSSDHSKQEKLIFLINGLAATVAGTINFIAILLY